MCKYCNGNEYLLSWRGYARKNDGQYGTDVYVENGVLYISAFPDSVDAYAHVEEEIEINFCPKCGRNFKEDVNA